MTPLAITGLGLVSPLGATPAEHVVFAAAEVGPRGAGAFVRGEERVDAAYCPWIDVASSLGDRLGALASQALATALGAQARTAAPDFVVLVVTPDVRDCVAEEDRRRCEELAAQAAGGARTRRSRGLFAALADAERSLMSGGVSKVAVVVVDSWISPARLEVATNVATPRWAPSQLRPSEAAAAVVLARSDGTAGRARRVAALVHADERAGRGTDDDDEAVDGAALTALIHAIPPGSGVIEAAFGPHRVDSLRRREWELALARCSSRFALECHLGCAQTAMGRIGFASGAANLVFGVATTSRRGGRGPVLAWDISPSGVRGLCVLEVGT